MFHLACQVKLFGCAHLFYFHPKGNASGLMKKDQDEMIVGEPDKCKEHRPKSPSCAVLSRRITKNPASYRRGKPSKTCRSLDALPAAPFLFDFFASSTCFVCIVFEKRRLKSWLKEWIVRMNINDTVSETLTSPDPRVILAFPHWVKGTSLLSCSDPMLLSLKWNNEK